MVKKTTLFKRGVLAAVLALACATALSATAFAASSTWPVPTSPMTNTVTAADGTVKTVVTASANGCYRTFPEILGLSNPLCNPGKGASTENPAEALLAMQGDPDYGLYGSPANNSPDAYMWNYYYNFYARAQDPALTEADPDVTCITCNDGAAGINQTAVAAYGGVCAAFYHRPDIAYGLGTVGADGAATAYATYVQTINSFTADQEWYRAGDETYDPQLIDCRGEYGQKFFHISTLYDLAQAAQIKITESGNTKTTRYGDDPYEYAVEFEKLVRGTNYTVLKAIAEKKTTRKTVAFVNSVDTDTKKFQLTVTDPSVDSFEAMYQNVWGGQCIRYMYAPNILECITDNIGEVNKLTIDEKGLYVATVEDLAKCDALMLRTGNGMGDCTEDAEKVKQLFIEAGISEAQIPPMYYTYPTFPGGGGGNYAYVSYYPTMISFVYPEILNPSYMEAYYCQTVYHVASTYLEDAMNILFAKASRPAGYDIDLSGYSYEAVSNQLNSGLRYYVNHSAEINNNYPTLIMTQYLKENIAGYAPAGMMDGAAVTLSKKSYTYNGKACEPAVSVKLDGKDLVAGDDYLVSYSNNKNAGTAKVTITGIGDYEGTKTVNFKINKAANKITAKNKTVKAGKSVNLGAKAKDGKLTYKVNTKAKKAGIKVNAKGKVTTKKKTKKGSYKITIKVKATKNYKAASKTVTLKVKK